MKLFSCLVLVGVLISCRTEIAPLVRVEAVKAPRMIEADCRMMDYRMATDVPAGSKNLGWVSVSRQETDEATFDKLREAICLKGGSAYSQARWVRPAGASVADPPIELEANAWTEPE
jgi:hypothetical protein